MVKLVAPVPMNSEIPVFLNIDANVGKGQPNVPTDVLLVQFFMRKIADKRASKDPKIIGAFAAVRPTGFVDAPTINAINATQLVTGASATGDNHVSVARGYTYGGRFYEIVILSNTMVRAFPDLFPRIDRIEGCPPQLASAVRLAVVGKN